MVNEAMLYDSVTAIAEDYFGPAAPRFVSRIVTNHLGKLPNQVKRKDIPELITWIKLTAALLTDDMGEVNELAARLKQLA
jgi:hypothetical protein